MPDSQDAEAAEPLRAALYVDGFNLYYSLVDLGKNHLKWLNLQALGRNIIPQRSQRLVRVTFCTALPTNNPERRLRHRVYVRALEHHGVHPIWGHHIEEPRSCPYCGVGDTKLSEKQTDINVALSLFTDALDDVYDAAYLLSADSDQAATARYFKQRFAHKKLIAVAPPNRPPSSKVMKFADGKIELNSAHIERARMPSIILRDGGNPIRCPREYDLPR